MKDIIGKKFNRLTILKADEGRPSTYECQKYYLCKCDCGNTKSIRIDHVKTGRTKSCGCYAREQSSELGKAMSYKIKGWNFKDLRGQKFGKLTVVELVRHGEQQTSTLWLGCIHLSHAVQKRNLKRTQKEGENDEQIHISESEGVLESFATYHGADGQGKRDI